MVLSKNICFAQLPAFACGRDIRSTIVPNRVGKPVDNPIHLIGVVLLPISILETAQNFKIDIAVWQKLFVLWSEIL